MCFIFKNIYEWVIKCAEKTFFHKCTSTYNSCKSVVCTYIYFILAQNFFFLIYISSVLDCGVASVLTTKRIPHICSNAVFKKYCIPTRYGLLIVQTLQT